MHGYILLPALTPHGCSIIDAIQNVLFQADVTGASFAGTLPAGTVRQQKSCTLRDVCMAQPALALVLRGEKHVHVWNGEKTPQVVERGGLVLFPAGHRVTFTNTAVENQYHALCITLTQQTVQNVIGKIPAGEWQMPPTLSTLYSSILQFVRFAYEEKDVHLATLQLEQIAYLCAKYGLPVSNEHDSFVASVRKIVEEKPGSEWTSTALAKEMSMGERTFRRKLQLAGYTCSGLVRVSRLHAALSILQQSTHSVEEVAWMCGYASRAKFSVRFKEYFGLPPRDVHDARTFSVAFSKAKEA